LARLKAPYFDAYFSAELRGRKLPPRFGVVTAHDPMGRKAPPAANRRRDAALRRRLKAMKLAHFRVTGGSEDGAHREPGWGVIADQETVRALAALYEQDAYFWISSGRVGLGAAAGGPLKRAGSWTARRARWRVPVSARRRRRARRPA
jgi:hypothetical protein